MVLGGLYKPVEDTEQSLSLFICCLTCSRVVTSSMSWKCYRWCFSTLTRYLQAGEKVRYLYNMIMIREMRVSFE